ncbi:MAG: TerB family tellurite resistance protein [Verrucomicrobia bacterium]|nr:TerB family tellurite resistance protein [Verrucomicrobiota bacterium]
MNLSEQKAALTLALLAAFADGENADHERAAVRRMAEGFGPAGDLDLIALTQDALLKRRSVGELAAEFTSVESRLLAYEFALGVCEADGPANERERAFLAEVRAALDLGAPAQAGTPAAGAPAGGVDGTTTPAAAPGTASPPPAPARALEPVDTAEIDKMVLNYAILNGALELLPQNLATMAIVPLQMRMVYRIGKRHGYPLDRGHIRDFIAAAGVGFASQAVENIARKLIGGLAGQLLGGLGRGLGSVGTGTAFTFAATYALGQLAHRYYAGGRKMESAVLRDTYARLLLEGRGLFGQHAGAVEQRARSITPSEVMGLVRGPV